MKKLDKRNRIELKSIKEAMLDGSYAFWPFAFTKNAPDFVLTIQTEGFDYQVAFNGIYNLPTVLRKAATALNKAMEDKQK